jgi:3-oxoacyl-[acyl-carrier protein] reductase
MNTKKFKDKVVLVTGASRGIGAGMVSSFSKQGAKVVVNYHQSKKKAEQVTRSLEGEAMMVQTDVSDRVAVERMVKKVVRKWGRIDILVNNAGGVKNAADWKRVSEQAWKRTIDVNLGGVFNCIRAVLPIMLKQKSGKIVNVASLSGVFPGRAIAPAYTAAKAGVINLTQALAMEAAPQVNVNAVVVGRVSKKGLNVERRIPLARLAKINDVVGAVEFLASEEASYITGQSLIVDGGLSLRWIV